ncbi:protein PML-like [Tiliqua scincoides]|uniref:protein PML-like n=1 Tax=Tiliqua scincoides TaxID=71010 RepID=UPI003461A0D5
MMTQTMSGPSIPPSETWQEMDVEFQFLLCDRCQKEVERPKLVSCLHNLCTECLEESKPIGLCSICGTPHSQNAGTPNLLFENLQVKLRIYRKVTEGNNLVCDSCKEEERAEFWCSDCEEFLCLPCFQCHQRFLKRESHEAKPLKDLRAESSKDFLAGFRKLSAMTCSNHNNQPLSLYCTECKQAMCCICVLLDSKHSGQHCEIQKEIQCRKDELQGMNMELKKKKIHYLDTWRSLQDLVKNKEKVKNETRELVQQKIDAVLRLVQEKGEKLLAAVDERHSQDVQVITEKLQHVKGTVRRMGCSERLVEKMHLYASDQEVMDMQPFIRECLEELKSKEPPAINLQVQTEDYTEVKTQVQALFERITAEKEGVPLVLEEAPQQNCSINLPAKRNYVQDDKAIQVAAKVIKTEPDDNEGTTSCSWFEQPGTSSVSVGTGLATESGLGKIVFGGLVFSSTSSEAAEPEDPNLGSWSEEESSDDEPLDASLLESNQEEAAMYLIRTPTMLNLSKSTLVFFDLKIIPGKILQLVAVADNSNRFSVKFRLTDRGEAKTSLDEIGLGTFLYYLQSLPMPVLVGYNLWSMNIPDLVTALEAIKKEESFKASILGFLDALPLIKQKIPYASSYTLKELDHTYFWGQLDDTQAEACANSLRDLWTVLDVNPVMENNPVIAYSSLQCYTSLQPLVKEKFLSRASAETLAVHNLSFSTLQSAYQNDPERGLQRLRRCLNSKLENTEKKIKSLNKLRGYFQSLPSTAWHKLPATSS